MLACIDVTRPPTLPPSDPSSFGWVLLVAMLALGIAGFTLIELSRRAR